MSSHTCQICGICPGKVRPELSSVLPYSVCSCCLEPSYGGNWRHMGRPSHLPSFSVEFEVAGFSSQKRNRALVLLSHGYLRTSDDTVDDEYKSPIYHDLHSFRAHLPILDTLRSLVTDACGTHLHVGVSASLKRQLTLLRGNAFGPLVDRLIRHLDETAQFWGRETCFYAKGDLDDAFPCIHTQSQYDTIEFRLPCFQTASQYLEVVRFCRRVVHYLHRSIIDHVGAKAPEQLGKDVLSLYQTAVKQQAAYINSAVIQQSQQATNGASASLILEPSRP